MALVVSPPAAAMMSGCDLAKEPKKAGFPVGGPFPIAGTRVTAESVVDVVEIKRVTAALTNGLDAQQWALIEDTLLEQVDTTIGETQPGTSRVKPRAEIVARWKKMYQDAEKLVIHHATSNERVYFHDRDNATVYSNGVIILENTPAGDFASEGGTLRGNRWVNYEYGVARTDKGWKVNKVIVDYRVQEFTSLPGPKKAE